MPSLTATPAQLVLTAGSASFIPYRFTVTAAALELTAGSATLGPTSNLSGGETTPKLDRIGRQERIVDKDVASQRFRAIWQGTMEAIERAFSGQQDQITDLETIVQRLGAAEAKSDAAFAQASATAAEDALAKSFPSPSDVLSAASSGTITITAHTRVYGDGTSVSVNGGSVSGYSPGQFVQVYYDDAGRAGGAVSYQGTTDVIAQAGARHIVGGVSIPLVGEAPIDGVPPFPPGYVPDYREFPI